MGVVRELDEFRISLYLIRIHATFSIGMYILKKWDHQHDFSLLQGPVLGLLLWNIYYDGVFRLRMPEGITPIVHADDLTIVQKLKGIALKGMNKWQRRWKKESQTGSWTRRLTGGKGSPSTRGSKLFHSRRWHSMAASAGIHTGLNWKTALYVGTPARLILQSISFYTAPDGVGRGRS